ncbi:dialkylresorcinol condensing enzyme DarA [Aureibaculum sp. 2210JD6-5]|uniref:dialkylrecorsinol condensing enzyme DarA n=1 Tax=Aureibaculum sp. 2210JD6-5 TaxID=3103957 RepID=UPI002AADD15E|nr:dialkylrecorsinol condensing enzyme DarA [Aureibaculum sp. 2210JD6-5]MDY7393895.1 dialkylresorcinol condensing enzyme DarA [Aureibaculum sp. 2210JD6-5]
MKNVLIIYYTQSGQLLEIAQNVVRDVEDADDVNVAYHQIKPVEEYKFPWKADKFFDAFPESFLQIPCELVKPDPEILSEKYDLVIIAYQVWYLTPSIPINSFLKSEEAKKILKDTPVVTVIGCRNMWIKAQEKMKVLLLENQAKLVGNIALVDRNINHISVITIEKWMFSGKKEKYLGVFPKPGVSQKDIDKSIRFGKPILESICKNDYENLQDNLLKIGAVKVKPFLITMDKRANVIFDKWSKFIIKKGKPGERKRLKWVRVFDKYLKFAIWCFGPILFIVFLLTYLPFIGKIKKDQKYYASVNHK